VLASSAAFFLGKDIFAGQSIQTRLGAPGSLRPVFGAALYLATSGLLSLGLGALIRRIAGAVAILIALIFLPVSDGALTAAWRTDVNPYLPSVAGQAIIGPTKFTPPGHLLAPWTGLAVFCGYAAVALIAAAITFSHRYT
jgi:ABC-2 type transport system permease protein